ncbi:MAG: hypothetical protein ABI304_02955 [Rudaea sp.]
MRNLFLFLLGIAIGVLATANIVTALRQRDAYPRGLMNVMQHHYAELREQVDAQRCSGQISAHLAVMRLLSNQIESAIYGNQPPDSGFHTDADDLRQSLNRAESASKSPNACVALVPELKRVGDACDTCHRSYR